MRVLVTGGAGAIGSWVVEALLARGEEVAVLDSFHDFYPRIRKQRNLAAAQAQPGFYELFETDIRDTEGVARAFDAFRPQGVIHLAARAGVRPSLEDPVTYSDVNLTGTSVVLEASRRAGVERLVFASSSSVYGERPRGPFVEDLVADRPLSPYGATKRAGELLCHAAYSSTGMPISCLRFFTAYGPRQRPDLAIHRWSRLALEDKPIPVFGDGSAERDFTFVHDLVDGILSALDRANAFRVYNLGRGEPVTLNETIRALEKALGMSVRRDQQPCAPGDVPRTWASIERAREELGYQPKTQLEAGIAAFVDWFRSEMT
ncbi:MAG: NAD-dependent epimerase/dehydratase family protein [bacterium]|nr:NAD-dependent epimerase/dehydratase family protein [bacterium]